MSATEKQIKFIDDLQTNGAPIPCDDHGNPDDSMFESVSAAHEYIRANRQYMKKFDGTKMRADEYGGVYNA